MALHVVVGVARQAKKRGEAIQIQRMAHRTALACACRGAVGIAWRCAPYGQGPGRGDRDTGRAARRFHEEDLEGSLGKKVGGARFGVGGRVQVDHDPFAAFSRYDKHACL